MYRNSPLQGQKSLTSPFAENEASQRKKVSVILSCYNEEGSIVELIERLRSLSQIDEILVVDDGSTDRTAERAESAGARVVRHPYHLGNGAAVKTGIRRATGDVVVLMDGDGQHPPEEISKLIDGIGEFDMVVGARSGRSEVSRFRTFGNKMLAKVAEYLAGTKIPDLTSGFRAVKREKALEFLHLFPNTYSYPTTITLSFLKASYFVKYVFLDSIGRRRTGKSHLHPLRDGFRFLIIITRMVMLFSPLRVFLPLGLLLGALGMFLGTINLFVSGGIRGSSIVILLSSILIVLFGFLADQVSVALRGMKGQIDFGEK